jgi:TonB family protein
MRLRKMPAKTKRFSQRWSIIMLFILCMAFYNSYAQDTIPDLLQSLQKKNIDTLKYGYEETFPPEFPGGNIALQKYISKSIRWEKGMKNGKVVVRFTIGANGYLTKAKIIRSVSALNDAEVIRVLNTMPQWVPISKVFKTVPGEFVLPVTFLNNRVINPPLSNSRHL